MCTQPRGAPTMRTTSTQPRAHLKAPLCRLQLAARLLGEPRGLLLWQQLPLQVAQPAVLSLKVKQLAAPECQVEAGAVDERHVQRVPQHNNLVQQRLYKAAGQWSLLFWSTW